MAVTQSEHGAVIKAGTQGDVIPGRRFKALFWVLSGATVNTHLLQLDENDADGTNHIVYADAAPKTDGAVPIPCPEHPVDGLVITDMDNGYVIAYPIE